MQTTVQGNAALINTLSKLCPPEGVRHTADQYGNAQHWFELSSPMLLVSAAAALKDAEARLSLITGYARNSAPDSAEKPAAACYHFVLDGVIYNLTATLTREEPYVPTITSYFVNADWHEREMMELVGITVSNQPNPTRLFLNAELDPGVLKEYVPLSVMMNGACSKDLWEHILGSKEGGH
ncbi:MAG: NADH-quinone oxidoreductase subunit C [Desulfovibrionaceae bacterium]|nr:NADH-quinone oxidoreductase subunit C [Desulfovibrionaceae bacterium]